ncbi:MAG TPA: class I SAM-dependent methyltransferase [candidate division Zixibacteria bacterium]|nr:class I SAM-dependent methyltransferase [candidate division Zixibacteria bacterium]
MDSIARKNLVREYYSKRATEYDLQKSRTWKTQKGFGNEVFDELLEVLEGSRNGLLLEVGVGSGRNALPLLEKVKPHLVGLDLSKEMLKQARTKMFSFREGFDLILADGDHLPFVSHAFDAIICMSTMHYFTFQGRILKRFRKTLRENGTVVYGDLTVHETDNQGFFEGLERTLSKAHARYYKPSRMKKLMEKQGFCISKMKTIAYRKTYGALMEDKGQYFGVAPETLHHYLEGAPSEAKEQYGLTRNEMTLFYTVITAKKKPEPR